MRTFSSFFFPRLVRTVIDLAMLSVAAALLFVFFNANVSTAQSGGGGPVAGQRFTLFNGGGGQTLTQPLGSWAFCMLVENKIEESGGTTSHSCRIDGGLNSAWTLVSHVGNQQDGQCSAFCVRW